MEAQFKFLDSLHRRYEDTRERLFNLEQALESHEEFLKLIDQHIADNKNMQRKCDGDEHKRSFVLVSYDKLYMKYDKFRRLKLKVESEYNDTVEYKKQIEDDMNSMWAQILLSSQYNANTQALIGQSEADPNTTNQSQYDQNQSLVNLYTPVATSQPPQQALQSQQFQQQQSICESAQSSQAVSEMPATFDYGVETVNFLNEDNWFLGDSCNRDLAEKLLSNFVSGTFLVRSSRKKERSYALSVKADNKVQHCLIDETADGFCFHPPGPQHQLYPTLCSLVLDYREKSLLLHHPELNTSLIYPVMSEIKKIKR